MKKKRLLSTKDICLIGIFAALTAILAQIAVPLPFTPMPLSFGLVAVYISAILLRPRCAIFSQICYLLLGAVGLPVFGGFRGGLGALFGPTGGYLLVYPVMAAIVSITLNSGTAMRLEAGRGKGYTRFKGAASICAAHLILYFGGSVWLSATTGNTLSGALLLAAVPFIPLDIVKIIFCVTAVLPLRHRLIKTGFFTLDAGISPETEEPDANTAAKTSGILARALKGQSPSFSEAMRLMNPDETPLAELMDAADGLTRQHFGNQIGLCAIYAAKVGHCSGDCAFCAQSVHHSCSIVPVQTEEIDPDEIVNYAKSLEDHGVERLSLVTSGERLTEKEFEYILNIYRRLHAETGIGLCASLGKLDEVRAALLSGAGVTRYHHNIETAPSYFPHICSTHTYDDKLETIRIARDAGLGVCSGGILSMGESAAQRVEMAMALLELDVDCVPLNILNPIPGTRLEGQELLDTDDILRTIAVFRLILQDKTLRYAGGRENAMVAREYEGYTAGINAQIIGDYLTTPGKEWDRELRNLAAAGKQPPFPIDKSMKNAV